MMGDNVLEIRELSKDYGDFVLDKVSFSLPRGVIMGLIGENGAGKSTTINCILNETQKLVVKYSFLVKTIFQMKSKLKISSAWFSMKIISLTSSRQKKSGSSCLEFIPAGIGRFIASISKNLNCRRIKKLKIFPKA